MRDGKLEVDGFPVGAVEGSLEVDGELEGMLLGSVDTLGVSLATFVGLVLGLIDGIAVG